MVGPLVTVVCWAPRWTEGMEAGFESLASETLTDWELIVVGPASEPACQRAQSLGLPARRIPSAVAHPQAAALNGAVLASGTPFVAFAEAGDRAAPERLAAQHAFLAAHASYGLVAAGVEHVDRAGTRRRCDVLHVTPERLLACLLHENVVTLGTVMVRRNEFVRLDGFDNALRSGIEHDLWLRIGTHSRAAALARVQCWRLVSAAAAWPNDRAAASEASCADDHRRDHVVRVLRTHPHGRRIVEDAVSLFPDDDVLWECFASAAARRGWAALAAQPSAGSLGDPGEHDRGSDRPREPNVPMPPSTGGATDPPDLFIQCLRHRKEGPAPFNRLAHHYDRRGNTLMAHLCRLRSLAVDAGQAPVLDAALLEWSRGVTAPPASPLRPQTTTGPTGLEGPRGDCCAVSVLMPTRNRARLIGESIRSVLGQIFTDLELVIVNDGGLDDTEHVVQSFHDARIRYVRTEHRGLAAALNTAASRARGRYIAYLDDDDVFYADHLARVIGALETSGAAMAYSKSRLIFGCQERGRFSPELDIGTYTLEFDPELLRRDCIISTLNVVHRRDCLGEVGGFDERLARCMDWDLWVRLSERSRVVHLDVFTGEYRLHGDNMNLAHFAEGRVYTDLLRNYFTSSRGLAILLHAACVQARVEDTARVRRAMEGAHLGLSEEIYARLVDVLPRAACTSRLLARLAAHSPRWYLRALRRCYRSRGWQVLLDIPAPLYPRLIGVGVTRYLSLASRGLRGA